jgi:hypothetical protein
MSRIGHMNSIIPYRMVSLDQFGCCVLVLHPRLDGINRPDHERQPSAVDPRVRRMKIADTNWESAFITVIVNNKRVS